MSNPTPPAISKAGTRGVTVATALVAMLLAVIFDVWYGGVVLSRERQRTLANAAPYVSAIEAAVNRRLSRLTGLRTFVIASRSLTDLNESFEPYANGMRVGASGIRALELVSDGRITHVVPLAGNETALNYNLYGDPRPVIANDVRRALATGAMTVTGPTKLVQGGLGLIVRQKVGRADPDFPELVAMVVDIDAVVDEVAPLAKSAALAYRLTDRTGAVVTSSDSALSDAVSLPVRLPDGNWHVQVAPTIGWSAATAEDMRPTRIASFFLIVLLSWLSHIVAGNQRRLRSAVAVQTQDLRAANVALIDEVRERKLAEQQLKARDERLRLALTSGRMGIWEFQPSSDRLHLSLGALTILGTPDARQDVVGTDYLNTLPAEAKGAVQKAVMVALESGDVRAEGRLTMPSGDDRWIYFAGEMQRNADGTELLVGVIMDVTERRQLEEKLLHSQKMEAVGTLAGGVAHDFNNLLTAILGFAQLSQQQAEALTGPALNENTRHGLRDLRLDLDEIVKAGERASMLTGQLLAFSRRQVTKPVRVDLSSVVRDVERMLQRLIEERITLVTQYCSEPLYLHADPGQLAQVVVNLVVNARDAIADSGTIRVTTLSLILETEGEAPFHGLRAGRWNVLVVEDDGVGMSADVLSRMFEPFYTTKLVGEGTGLGLSTVYGIVTQAGGSIFVESTEDEGTTVRVAFPWHGASERTMRTPLAVAAIGPAGKRVLVVEDEPGLRRLVAEILLRRGFSVEVATDGADALTMLDTMNDIPDLILTDVVMPRLGGPEMAEHIRQRGLAVPILFMSGYPADKQVPVDVLHAFIDKPFTPDALVKKVRDLLEPQ